MKRLFAFIVLACLICFAWLLFGPKAIAENALPSAITNGGQRDSSGLVVKVDGLRTLPSVFFPLPTESSASWTLVPDSHWLPQVNLQSPPPPGPFNTGLVSSDHFFLGERFGVLIFLSNWPATKDHHELGPEYYFGLELQRK